jgi:hypothetical protein
MKRVALIIIFVVICSVLFAQDAASAAQPVYDRLSNGLGLEFGGATGAVGPLPGFGGGLSYQQWFGGFGYQLEVWVSYPATSYSIDYTQSTVGLQTWVAGHVMSRLLAAQFADWFFSELHLYGGVDHAGFVDAATWSSYAANFLTSAGFGFQAGLFQHFVFTLELGYGISIPQFWIGLVVRSGLHYRF